MNRLMSEMLPSARASLPMRFAAAVVLAVTIGLVLFSLLMRPPFQEMRAMAGFLSVTALGSGLAGYAAYRWEWLSRSPRLSWTLMGIWALSAALTFLNVYITARLMFVNQHDLTLATILLLFAGAIAMSLGYFLSITLTKRMEALCQAAEQIADGRYGARAALSGNDEMARLANMFDTMASQLEATAHRQQEIDALRRDLIAWVGHDLRTPLASIRALVEALADGVVDDPFTVARYLHITQREVRSLSSLIDDLFELAQLDSGGLPLDLRANSIADLISDTLESFSALASHRKVQLEGSAQLDADPILADGQKIGRVLANLVANALRYTPEDGKVVVRAFRQGSDVHVQVLDTGDGISSEDLPFVFEKFYRGEKSRSRVTGGTGLGLAIARAIIEAHGGHIWVSSPPGSGACFTFSLPLAEPPTD